MISYLVVDIVEEGNALQLHDLLPYLVDIVEEGNALQLHDLLPYVVYIVEEGNALQLHDLLPCSRHRRGRQRTPAS